MIDYEMPSNDISTRLDICSMKPSHIVIVAKEDNVKDVHDDNIGTKMNKQVPLEELSPPKVRLYYS